MTSARKFKLQLAAPKPRNPVLAQLATGRAPGKAGSHRKTEKARRAAEKAALKKEIG
jgi:hypothetical protein